MIVKYSKVQMTATTKKTNRSLILLMIFNEKVSRAAHSGLDVPNRHSVEGLGHVGINKPCPLYEAIRKYRQS